MKTVIACLLITTSIQTTFCMGKVTALAKQMGDSAIGAKEILSSAKGAPKNMDAKSRAAAVQHLMGVQDASKKLLIILNDLDGWVTEESEK